MITFVLFEAAYFAEIMRAGIQSVKRGQYFAAIGLGLNYAQTMRYVIIPQALRNMLPVLLTQIIILFRTRAWSTGSAATLHGRAKIAP